jgi:L-threonylcarbamoyladenylate synthase
MLLITGDDPARMVAAVREAAAEVRSTGAARVGIIACEEHADQYTGAADEVLVCGSRAAPAVAAQQLYATLRRCDRLNLDAIVAEGFSEAGLGEALMNRLRKAANGHERRV